MTNILYICEIPAFHVSNEVYVLNQNNCNVTVLNVFKSPRMEITNDNGIEHIELINLYNSLPLYPSIKYLPFYSLFINKTKLRNIVEQNNIDVIYSSWSSVVLPEAALIKRMYPELHWIHRFLMYPASLNKLKVLIENNLVWNNLKYADHVMVHTNRMRNYLANNVNPQLAEASVVIEKFNEQYFCDKPAPKLSDHDSKSHLIFLGSFTDHTDTNGLYDLITQLSDNVIIHMLESNISRDKYKDLNNKASFYSKKELGRELTCFIKQFDGVLALYPEEASSSDRVNNVIPNRITLALPSGLPIFIPRGQLHGAIEQLKTIVHLYQFDSASNLEDLLELTKCTNHSTNIESVQLGMEFIDAIKEKIT